MPSKQAIIDNIERYSAEELFDYIQNEVVSFDELCNETEGFFPANVRREVQRMLESAEGGVSQKTVKRNPRSQSRMPGKQAIIDNIEQYSATDLVEYIKNGIVSFDELCNETEGYFPANVRKEVQRMLASSDNDDWLKALEENTEESYKQFLRSHPDSSHRSEARECLEKITERAAKAQQISAWEKVDKDSVQALNEFIKLYPDDDHVREATQRINQLEKEEFLGFDTEALIQLINGIKTDKRVIDKDDEISKTLKNYIDRKKISVKDLLKIIAEDHNFLRATTIRELIRDGYASYQNFVDLGIDRRFIQCLAKEEKTQSFRQPDKRLDRINKVCTEVYFWGIPSSGKSCALGAILSVASNGTIARSMRQDNDCQGYDYMNRLAYLFKNNGTVGLLPEGTSISSTYEMGFDLEDQNYAVHPVTCIDLAGELVRCMYKLDAHLPMGADEEEALDTLTRILIDNRTQNRKIHFFVLEYGGENREYEGLNQTVYLNAALRYIERTGIFKKDTDAIYLMYTKVDKTKLRGAELVQELINYTDLHYKGFFQGLEKIARDCEINGGRVERIPFTLGEVCFQDYCLFDGASASNVVKKLLETIPGSKNGKIQKLSKLFKL